jgi:diguanylate cyclase (GGDEF)-like protein
VDDLNEFHWLMDILQSIDVGLVVLDEQHHIKVWNTFMENHSSRSAETVRDKNLFDEFPDTNQQWFRQKLSSVFQLKSRAFSTWEQRPYLFQFHHYRPFTSAEPFMYQNLTILPLSSATGEVKHLCIIIYDVTEVATHRKMAESQHAQLKDLTRKDSLTDLYIRHYWDGLLTTEYLRYTRDEVPRTLLMLDVDLLKDINDEYDYGAGDEAIKHVARHITGNQRDTDFSGRYGGDKFVLLLTETTEQEAEIVANRLHRAIGSNRVYYETEDFNVQVSIGIAELTLECPSALDWISWAERAMQEAKILGRNQVIKYSVLG